MGTTESVPDVVLRAIDPEGVGIVGVDDRAFDNGTGAASAQISLLKLGRADGSAVKIVRKTYRPLLSGRHAEHARRRDHWAYWRRELQAYGSGSLPTGPGLRAPNLYGVVDDGLYIEYVGERQPPAVTAALQLGRWHGRDASDLDRPWLAKDQLAQRLAVSDLDWSAVDVDPRIPTLWAERDDAMTRLARLPWSITHGDFSLGNVRLDGDTVIALDWATLGTSPVGFDLAHLALSTRNDSLLPAYVEGLGGRFDTADVELGYRIAVSLVGASRIHWMASRSTTPPAGYADFVASHRA